MTKKFIMPLAAFLALPFLASAHEQQVFDIGGEEYRFVVGSLNEPIVVDDKTGVELRVSLVGHEDMAADDHHGAGGAVLGLEEDLQVELIAGDKKKVLALSPTYGTPGSYKAPFFPTVPTTLSYRFFGKIDETPVDIIFTCSQVGHTEAKEDTSRVEISPGVVRTFKTGAFGCPAAKEDMGFPEQSASLLSLEAKVGNAKAISLIAGMFTLLALSFVFFRRS